MTNQQLVKITSSGKVCIMLGKSLKVTFLQCLEGVLTGKEWANRVKLDAASVGNKIHFATLSEIYTRHFTTLNMLNQESRLLLTVSQALTLWELSQEYDVNFYNDPEMGNLLMQLHQKLS